MSADKQTHAAQPGKKKTAPLRIGFVPLSDCAPLAVAYELGYFAKYGLKIQLQRELGWATIRDKIIYGELEAAHAVAGMPLAATFGFGSIRCDCVTGLVLSLQGNAITLSRELRDLGVRDAKTLRGQIIKARGSRVFTFGVPFLFASHNFLLRQWLAAVGIQPGRDVQIVVVPPPQMAANLAAGNLDGYCVGEPWNSVAVQRGIGWCAATSAQLAPRHPEKVLVVRRVFAQERAAEHLAVIAALLDACDYCDNPSNALEMMTILAKPQYLNGRNEALGRSLCGSFDFGDGHAESADGFHIFFADGANEPSREKAAWVIRTMIDAGLVPNRAAFPMDKARQVFRADIFSQARQLRGTTPPKPTTNDSQTNLVNV
jgi:ABC-type nitrate/sulfonate/bicarbonate transport system substrate-binding protein